jgi:glycosyltransferase involved in cell wall biosynthesis
MDHVVCVAEAQAAKVLQVGVPAGRVTVIRNAIRTERFAAAEPSCRETLQNFFPSPRSRIIGAAGRLSPEKGFDVLIEAASRVAAKDRSIGFVLFGDGSQRDALAQQVTRADLGGVFVLAGFRTDLDRLLPSLDLFVHASFREGLPNVVLEALAAQVPVVSTAVDGTPEVLEDGVSGYMVPLGDVAALAERVLQVLASEERRREMGQNGHRRVHQDFTFTAQSQRYRQLFRNVVSARAAGVPRHVYGSVG